MTIKEIAELAGTSRGSVDRVLNGRGNVRKELADTIRAIAEEHGYTPNKLARALVISQKRFVIGVVVNSLGNPFFADVLEGIRKKTDDYRGYGLEVVVKEIRGYEEEEQLRAIEEVMSQGVDALGITPLDCPGITDMLNSLDVPIVTFNTDSADVRRLAFVGCDYMNSGGLTGDLAGLLLHDGGRIGVVIGSRHMLGHMQRVAGLRASLQTRPDIQITDIVENNDSDEKSYVVTRDMLLKTDPDLVYFAAAGTEGGIRAVREDRKKRLVLTVDETSFIRNCLREGIITATITQQPEEQGMRTIEVLYDYLANHKRPEKIQNYTENQVKLKNSK